MAPNTSQTNAHPKAWLPEDSQFADTSTPKSTNGSSSSIQSIRISRRLTHLVLFLLSTQWLLAVFLYQPLSSESDSVARSMLTPVVAKSNGIELIEMEEPAWGSLHFESFVAAAPISYARLVNPTQYNNDWFFQETTRSELEVLLAGFGVSEEKLQRLLELSEIDATTQRRRIPVTNEIISEIPIDVRAKIYLYLEKDTLNVAQANAFRFPCDSVDEWFHESLIRPELIDRIRSMAYRRGCYLMFADMRLLLPEIRDANEIAQLFQVLASVKTFMVSLHVDQDSDLKKLQRYWGCRGRKNDVAVLLESLSQVPGGASIDITHLLPSFARCRLYTYPKLSSDPLSIHRDCHWTAYNFFNSTLDDRIAVDFNVRTQILREEFYEVFGDYQLGDIISYVDGNGVAFHSSVYIADDIVFTKNGGDPLRPWYFLPQDEMLDYYEFRKLVRMRYYRRKLA